VSTIQEGEITMRRAAWASVAFWIVSPCLLADSDEWTKAFQISGRPELRLETSDGTIHVDLWDQKSLEIRVTTQSKGIKQGHVQVSDVQRENSVEINVRRHGAGVLSIGSTFTMIDVHMPREGKVYLQTGSGGIQLRGFKGELDLHSADGRVEIAGVDGSVTASAGSGHIRVEGRFDRLDLSTKDGQIEANASKGSTIGQGWNIKTDDGPVTLLVPESFAADIVLRTTGGKVNLEVPVLVEKLDGTGDVRGKLNGGGSPLVVQTGHGSIRLGKS